MFQKIALWASSGAFIIFTFGLSGVQAGQNSPKASPKQTSLKSESAGELIFRAKCASCHGAKGEGTAAYARPLAGNQSVKQLAKYIAAQMPPGPKKCSVAEADKVAGYIYDAFYSPIAQERNRPARVALSRLTVRQMRNAVCDLVSTFRPQPTLGTERGLRAEYFKAKNFEDKERLIQRTDPQVQFDFGTAGPTAGDYNPHQFSIRWDGSVVAPDTGVYEFIVRTEHSINLFINDQNKPLIDGWVKSGNDTEYKASLYLIGGRAYPLRLEFSKSTQGVDDTKQKEGKPAPKASISLSWKRPQQAEEIIPSRNLTPSGSVESFILSTPFPPDDRSMGYERGNSVSKAWDEATTSAALETADYVVAHLRELAGTKDDKVQLQAFCRRFVERALRQPLDAETVKRYIARQFEISPDLDTAVKRVVLLSLKSPRFLYREAGAVSTDPYAVASRLSFALWDSLPDDTLLKAAAAKELSTRDQVTKQATRMIADPRAWYKEREFFLQWLKVDQYPDLAKDAKRFPNFTPEIAADLRTSLDITLENIVRSERSDFRELLLTDKFYLNGKLAGIYGGKLAPNAPFQPVELDPATRAGILTHPYVLASFAYVATTSPIHRGVLLARSIMGRTLQPPPAAFVPLAADLHPKLTTRQRVTLQTKPAACMSCHSMINPLGYTLERFDAIGRLRANENGMPIDSTGSYETRTGQTVKFSGAQDLARYVADSEETHTAFVEKFFQYTVKQPIRAYGPQTIPTMRKTFQANGYNINKLMVEIATEAALPKAK